MLRCGIVILAAGEASRFGRPKQLASWQGTSLLRRSVQTALGSRCRPVIVVTGNQSEAMEREIAGMEVHVTKNAYWHLGIGTSIRAGVAAAIQCEPKPDAVCLLLCDQPMIGAAAIDRLAAAYLASGQLICAAFYSGTLGTPAIFSSTLFDELMNLADGEGGKAVIQRHLNQVEKLDLPEAAADVDTQDDLARLSDSTQ
jgi:molybdenum cofactor cytidylyltransferase